MRNSVQDGKSIGYVNPGGTAIPGGSLLRIVDLIGVPFANINPGAWGNVSVEGVYRLPKTQAENIAQGTRLFVHFDTGLLTAEPTWEDPDEEVHSNWPAGIAWEASPSGASTVAVKINA